MLNKGTHGLGMTGRRSRANIQGIHDCGEACEASVWSTHFLASKLQTGLAGEQEETQLLDKGAQAWVLEGFTSWADMQGSVKVNVLVNLEREDTYKGFPQRIPIFISWRGGGWEYLVFVWVWLEAVVCRVISLCSCLGALCLPLWDGCSGLLLDKPAHKDRSYVQQTGMECSCVPTAGLHQSAQRGLWVLESTGFSSQHLHL